MKIRTLFGIACLASSSFLAGCATTARPEVQDSVVITPQSLESDLKVIQSIQPRLEELDTEFKALPVPARLGRDYYDAQETAAIEALLFRFLGMQSALWDMVNRYGGLDASYTDDQLDAMTEVLSLTATLLIASHTALVVEQFAGDPLAIRQLNEAYYRSRIEFGTYDRMRESMTAPGMTEAVVDSGVLYAEQLKAPQSAFARLATTDTGFADLIARLPALHDTAEMRLNQVKEKFPSHADTVSTAHKDERKRHETLYAARSFMFKEVSRLKSPTAHIIEFTDDQKRTIFEQLRPGDLILTYTAGYMSDVFIPGAFKHGITYIGSKQERQVLDLSGSESPRIEGYEPHQLSANLNNFTLADGKQADMIEAVAEGVIFNNLEYILDTHVNRLLVLRPKLSDAEHREFLLGVFSYLGDGYDFKFDFADASEQVCTEVIYRALNGKGAIDFQLTVRAGHETLSADDIANYHLSSEADAFDFVLLVETDPATRKTASIFTGDEGEDKLRSLMESINES